MKIIKHLFYVKYKHNHYSLIKNTNNQSLVRALFYVKATRKKPSIFVSSPIFFILTMGISITIIFCSYFYYSTSTIHAQFNENPTEEVEEQPLFSTDSLLLDLLETPSPSINEVLSSDSELSIPIQNNPFAVQKSVVIDDESSEEAPEPLQLNSFEYRVDAIWKINESYKALISGHIVREKDTINTITIIKITKNTITIRKNNAKHIFELGQVFYDYEL